MAKSNSLSLNGSFSSGFICVKFKFKSLKSFLKSNSIDLARPKEDQMPTSELAKLATNATVYVECWMSLQAILEIIEKGESKKAFYPLN